MGMSTQTTAKKSPAPTRNIRKKKVQTTKSTAKHAAQNHVTTATVEVEMCAWFKCTKGDGGEVAPARVRSKYRGRACSNANARWNHKQRAKENKDITEK